jgi:hypothetical protein
VYEQVVISFDARAQRRKGRRELSLANFLASPASPRLCVKKRIHLQVVRTPARYFEMSVEFWIGIQTHYEVEKAKMMLGNKLETEVKVFASA